MRPTTPRAPPTGVVTLMFTDIEGSTRLLHRLGDTYPDVLTAHQRLIRSCVAVHDGFEVLTEGDAFFVAFSSPREAVSAAVEAQRSLHAHTWPHGQPVKVRMGLHTGEPIVVDGDYVGMDVHRAARIAACGHGGQIVVSARLLDLVSGSLPDGVRVRDLGDHWLKDLPAPEHLLQLDVAGLPDTFPPLKSLEPPTNVPRDATALVGRRRERRELREQLTTGDARLVTLTGPGGAGKTRLAAAVALDVLPEHPQGVWFVDLSRVTEAGTLVQTIARVLGLPLDSEEPAEEAVVRHVGDRTMLLVLDNLEQVVDAASTVGRLLARCPRLRVLGTSRILLGLRDERQYAVPAMTLPTGPSLAEVERSEAAQLFVRRAEQRSGFMLTAGNAPAVARICALLDGLPLAIELAAARIRIFSPQSLVDRLGDRLGLLAGGAKDAPERHRTLRATIDWSYTLLSPHERQFFCDFAVFNGGARLDSIEAVLITSEDVLELISALVDHNLVVKREDADGEPRFMMLQTIREYAVRRLDEDLEHRDELARRHAEHMLELLATAKGQVGDADESLVEREQDNLRAALTYWLPGEGREHARSPCDALRLAVSQGTYWYHHGLASEGADWLERALAVCAAPEREVEARARRLLGVMHEQRQELDPARDQMSRALQLYRELGDEDGEAKSLNSLGVIARSAGAAVEAERYVRAAVEVRRRSGRTEELPAALSNLGILRLDRGMWAEAMTVLDEALALDRSAGHQWGAACSTLNLAVANVFGRNVSEAQHLLASALTSFRAIGDPDGMIESLESTVGLATTREQWPAAARLAAAAAHARAEQGMPGPAVDQRHLKAWVEQTRAALGASSYDAAWAEGSVMTLEQAMTYAFREVLGGTAS